MPQVPITNFHEALKFDGKSSVKALLSFGVTCQYGSTVSLQVRSFGKCSLTQKEFTCFSANSNLVHYLQGEMEQSKMRQKSIANSPMAKLCESQMNKKNYLLPACRNVTQAANNLDHFNFKIKFNNIPDVLKNGAYKLYSVARSLLYPYVTENNYPQNPEENSINVIVDINKKSTALNVTMETPAMDVNFTNIRLNLWTRALLDINPAHSLINRIGNSISPLYHNREYISLSYYHRHQVHSLVRGEFSGSAIQCFLCQYTVLCLIKYMEKNP